MEQSIVLQLANTLGFGGVLAWAFYYMQTTTLPRLAEAYRAEAKAAREHSDAQLERIMAEHKAALEAIGTRFERMVNHCSSNGKAS